MNNIVCHGIPDRELVLTRGDIINVDVTVFVGGVHGDCSRTFSVGGRKAVDDAGQKLVNTTLAALEAGIAACGPGQRWTDVQQAVTAVVDAGGFTQPGPFQAHGIADVFHAPPFYVHYPDDGGEAAAYGEMRPGHAFTVEPMLNEGGPGVAFWDDDWTAETADGLRSAQWEHTVLITEHGVDVLTAGHKVVE